MDTIINLVLIVVGFGLLIKGADLLVAGASSMAKRFNISDIAIGLTVVAMGTSAPELVVNILAGTSGYNEVVFGNIIGSNIFNMFLILGIAAVIYPLSVQPNTLWKEVPYSLFATIIFFLLVNDSLFFGGDNSNLGKLDSVILIALFIGFLLQVFFNMKRTGETDTDEIEIMSNPRTIVMIFVGIVGLSVGGKFIVDNAVESVVPDLIGPGDLNEGDTLLICSDGLHGTVSDGDIAEIASGTNPAKATRVLIEAANRSGGPDNVSAAIARISQAQ